MHLDIISYSDEFPEYDEQFIKDVPKEYYGLLSLLPGSTVLDIGGHIGIFSAFAINAGASHVVYVEPTEVSRRHAEMNLGPAIASGMVTVIAGGVTTDPQKSELTLRYFADEGGMAGATVVGSETSGPRHWRHRPYTWMKSPAIQFSDLLNRYQPSILKLDCEGSEYQICQYLAALPEIPSFIRGFVAEWHGTGGKNIVGYLDATDLLRKNGFVPDKEIPGLIITRDESGSVIGSNYRMIRPISWKRP